MRRAPLLALGLAACDGGAAAPVVVAGERVGDVELGMRWGELRALLGEPDADPVVIVRLGHARWPALGLEALLTSPDETTLTDAAIVIGAATTAPARRAAIEAEHGVAPEAYAGHAYYPGGLAVAYGDDDVAERIAVFAAADAPRPGWSEPPPAGEGVVVDGRRLRVVDMHLHPGDYATMAATGKAFIAGNLPPSLQAYAPDLLDRLSDPYAAHVGIAAQTALAGVDHAVLFAVYAPRSIGVFDNAALLAALEDPRNVSAGGEPWAWGLASVDFEGWTDEVGAARLADLAADLAAHPDRLIGIKLAHAHQGVRLDDAAYHGVFAVAAEAGVPVLLHTGFSPFPGTEDDPAYYDPAALGAVLAAYPEVDLVLSHVGQGDARAVAHALDLAEAHDRVWLELSALGRPLLVDEDGAPVTSTEPQYPAVLAELRARGLVDRALFASDGPQYAGAVRAYLGAIVDGMLAAGYTADEIEAVLSGNFDRLFSRSRRGSARRPRAPG